MDWAPLIFWATVVTVIGATTWRKDHRRKVNADVGRLTIVPTFVDPMEEPSAVTRAAEAADRMYESRKGKKSELLRSTFPELNRANR